MVLSDIKRSWSVCFHDDPEKVSGHGCNNCGTMATMLVTYGGRYGFCCNDNVCRNAVVKEIMARAPKSPEMIAKRERESRQQLEHEAARLSRNSRSLLSARINGRWHEVTCPHCSRTFSCLFKGVVECPRCDEKFQAL